MPFLKLRCTAGQPTGSKRPFDKAFASTAWEAFNQYLTTYVPALVYKSFDETRKPQKPGFKEHEQNDATAKLLQEVCCILATLDGITDDY